MMSQFHVSHNITMDGILVYGQRHLWVYWPNGEWHYVKELERSES